MIKLIFALPMTVILLSGCASAPPTNLQSDDKRECAQNFTFDGSFLAGRTFKTHQFVGDVTKDRAIARAAKQLAIKGFSITNIDKEIGLISASQAVSYGNGGTVPLNVSIDAKDKGVDVSITFSISGGQTTPVNLVKDSFCETIEAVQGN